MNKKYIVILSTFIIFLLVITVVVKYSFKKNIKIGLYNSISQSSIISIENKNKDVSASGNLSNIKKLETNKKEKLNKPNIGRKQQLNDTIKIDNILRGKTLTLKDIALLESKDMQYKLMPDNKRTQVDNNFSQETNKKLNAYYNKQIDIIYTKIIKKEKEINKKVSFIKKIKIKRYISNLKNIKDIDKKKYIINIQEQNNYSFDISSKSFPLPEKKYTQKKIQNNVKEGALVLPSVSLILSPQQKKQTIIQNNKKLKEATPTTITSKIKQISIKKTDLIQQSNNINLIHPIKQDVFIRKITVVLDNELGKNIKDFNKALLLHNKKTVVSTNVNKRDFIPQNNQQYNDQFRRNLIYNNQSISPSIQKRDTPLITANKAISQQIKEKYKLKTIILKTYDILKLTQQQSIIVDITLSGTTIGSPIRKKSLNIIKYKGISYDYNSVLLLKKAKLYLTEPVSQYLFIYDSFDKIYKLNSLTINLLNLYKLKYLTLNNPNLVYYLYIHLRDYNQEDKLSIATAHNIISLMSNELQLNTPTIWNLLQSI